MRIRIRFRIQLVNFDEEPDVDPDPDFYLMRMGIQVTKMMRIYANLDPQHCLWVRTVYVFYKMILESNPANPP
jgi:hypothetical protein